LYFQVLCALPNLLKLPGGTLQLSDPDYISFGRLVMSLRLNIISAIKHIQGGLGNKKIYPGSDFFLRTLLAGLPTYVIRHTSKYGNITLASQALASPSQTRRFASLTHPVVGGLSTSEMVLENNFE
jgi:hypothetical protein